MSIIFGISLIGDFNNWKEQEMLKVHDGNFWECRVLEAKPEMMYKYRIYDKDGRCIDHCDPYGFGMELRPNNASIIRAMNYAFADEKWLDKRTDCKDKPLNIYEVHFAVDDYGLANYDGSALFEYPHSAVEFLRYMNQGLKSIHPSILLAAEDSTSFSAVTKSVAEGGLGFDYKWDMGWMNDTLNYCRTDAGYRSENYHKLTFSMMYYYDDRFLLPLSHDEVVHGKATIMQKMSGKYEEKFPQARAFYMYMYAHPGKKLNFMGNEIGQLREWDEKREQDWEILQYPIHDAFHRFMKDLNHLYLEHSALSERDYDKSGFQWLDCHQEENCIYAFERTSEKERIVAIFNFSDRDVAEYSFKVANAKKLERILTSNQDVYGGTEKQRLIMLESKTETFEVALSAYSAEYYLVK